MSLTVAAGGLFTTNVVFTNVATATAINVLHYRLGSISGTIPTMDEFLTRLAAAVNTLFITHWGPTASDQVKLVNVRATSVFPIPRSVGVNVVNSPPVTGGIFSEALPLQDCVTILKRTAVGNRWGMGRVFVTGIPESQQANGILSEGQRALYNTLATNLGLSLNVSGAGFSAVCNPCLVRGPEDNPVSITNVLRCEVSDNIIKTQRRRRPGKGI